MAAAKKGALETADELALNLPGSLQTLFSGDLSWSIH
jgi:hypothetical protein